MAKFMSKKWWQAIGTAIVNLFTGKKASDTAVAIAEGVADAGIPFVSGVAQSMVDKQDEIRAIEREDLAYERSVEQAEINREFQRQERLAAQEFNVDMWNRTNEYNSLSAQLARASAAGVNPNAIIGGATSGTTTQANPVSTSPMSGGAASVPSSGIASALMQNSAVVDNLRAQTLETEVDTAAKQFDLDFQKLTVNERRLALAVGIESQRAAIDKALAETELIGVNKEIALKTFDWTCRFNEVELESRIEQLNQLYTQHEMMFEQLEGLDLDNQLKVEQIEHQSLLNDAQKFQNEFTKITGIPPNTDEFTLAVYLLRSGEYINILRDAKDKGLTSIMTSLMENTPLGAVSSYVNDIFGSDANTIMSGIKVKSQEFIDKAKGTYKSIGSKLKGTWRKIKDGFNERKESFKKAKFKRPFNDGLYRLRYTHRKETSYTHRRGSDGSYRFS